MNVVVEGTEYKFQKRVLKIEIETEQEYRALCNLFSRNIVLPRYLSQHGWIPQTQCATLGGAMSKIHVALTERKHHENPNECTM